MGKKITTKAALQQALGASDTTVNRWTLKPEFPGGRNGPWDLDQVRAYLDSINSPITGGGGGRGGGKSDQLAQVALAKAMKQLQCLTEQHRKQQRENSQAEGRLVLKSEVELWAAEALGQLRDTLLGVAEAVAASIGDEQREFVRGEIDRKIREALEVVHAKLSPSAEHATGGEG